MAERRAVIFDLDDTLYPLRTFVLSGFRAVALDVAVRTDVAPALALDVLVGASASQPGRELQALAAWAGLNSDSVPGMVALMRRHVPQLRLPELSRAVLRRLRPGWRLGLVTNGRPDIQQRKVRALGLGPLVDAVVYAGASGDAAAKPAPDAFLTICRRLGVAPRDAVFVGNDPVTDIGGAHAAGLPTVWLTAGGADDRVPADVVTASLADVPAAAARLVPHEWRAHVA